MESDDKWKRRIVAIECQWNEHASLRGVPTCVADEHDLEGLGKERGCSSRGDRAGVTNTTIRECFPCAAA
jgi:hypothetical protein